MIDIDAIKARHAATTPGPWRWWGNTDSHNIALVGHQPGLGVCEVISTLGVERDPKGRDADRVREYAREYARESDFTVEQVEEEVERQVEEEVERWTTDAWGELIRDDRLAITDEKYIRHDVDTLAVYEVARAQGLPDDTPREHPKVYRGDIVALRNANARFLAAAWKDIADLVVEVERLRALTLVKYKCCKCCPDDDHGADLVDNHEVPCTLCDRDTEMERKDDLIAELRKHEEP